MSLAKMIFVVTSITCLSLVLFDEQKGNYIFSHTDGGNAFSLQLHYGYWSDKLLPELTVFQSAYTKC